jgi:hypothetical protein
MSDSEVEFERIAYQEESSIPEETVSHYQVEFSRKTSEIN